MLLNVRLAPLLGFFALLRLRPARGFRGALPIAFSVGLISAQGIDNGFVITRLQRDVAGLPSLLADLPAGSRLMTLNFSGFDREAAHFTPWLHVGSYHRVLHGGVASFSFSELTHWSVQYRPVAAPPKQDTLSWGMRPCLYRNERDGAYFGSFSFGERSIRSSTSRPGLDGECAARLPSTRSSRRIPMALWSPPAARWTTVRVRTAFHRSSGKLRPRRQRDSAVAERGEDAIEPEYGTQIPLRQRSCPALATFGAHALHEEAQRRLEPLQSLLDLQLWCC